MNKRVIVLFALALVLCQCKKKKVSDSVTPAPVVSEADRVRGILTSHPWKVSVSYYKGNEDTQKCEQDDVFTFSSSGDLALNIGTTKCSAEETNKLYRWSLLGDNKLVLMALASKDTLTVDFISDTQLILKSTDYVSQLVK